MTDKDPKVFLFQKDYTNRLDDRYFLWSEKAGLLEVDAQQVTRQEATLICHDYWLIAPSIFQSVGSLPCSVVDVEELRITTSCSRRERESRERDGLFKRLADIAKDDELLNLYKRIFNRSIPLAIVAYERVAPVIRAHWQELLRDAQARDELNRYITIEQPVANYLRRSTVAGVAIDAERLRFHKKTLDHDYYMALKKFSADYRMPLELPHDDDIVAYLEPRGFDFSGVNVDYVLDFVPMADGFAVDLRNLRKLAASRYLLSAIPYGQRRVFPLVDCFGSITSRIYFRDPSLQNLAKRHRDIVLPDPGFILSYVDYDQYEVGIMAALSGDPLLMSLYSAGDLYQSVAEKLFGDASRRKQAKRLFLSYAYGMKFKALVDAAAGFGARRTAARDFFRGFSVFEEWKLEIYSRFKKTNAIGTSLGNYLVRDPVGELSDREKRSSVSQVVQGTASLIFKKALLAISRDARLELKIPMHDAVLVQHRPDYEITDLVNIFSQTMTEHFEGRLQGKASLDSFTAG